MDVWKCLESNHFKLFALALNNQHPVTVHWFFGYEWRSPLIFIMLACFALGCAVGVVAVGLALSLGLFSLGASLLALSALLQQGMVLVVLAQLPIALGEAAFLPTSTQAVVELSPPRHGGLAMALFSQCFAISALASPLISGVMLDWHGHGAWLWTLMAGICLLSLRLVQPIRPRG